MHFFRCFLTFLLLLASPFGAGNGSASHGNFGLNKDPQNLQKITSKTNFSIIIPELNLSKIAQDIEKARHYINALTAQIPDTIRQQGRQAVDLYQDAMLYGMSGEQLQNYIRSPEFVSAVQRRNAWAEAVKYGTKSPEELARIAYLIAQGEKVYFDQEDKTYKIETDCSTQGPKTLCGVPIEQLGSLTKGQVQDFVSQTLAQLSGSIDVLDQHIVDKAYQCALTWTLMGGEDSVAILRSVGEKLQGASGYGLQRAVISAVAEYREANPTAKIDLTALSLNLRNHFVQASITELGKMSSDWNNGLAPGTVIADVQRMIGILASIGMTPEEQTQAWNELGKYTATYAFWQSPQEWIETEIFRQKYPYTAITVESLLGLGVGWEQAAIEVQAARKVLLQSQIVARVAEHKINRPFAGLIY